MTLTPTAPIDQMREAGHFEAIMGFQEYLGIAAGPIPPFWICTTGKPNTT